MKTILSKVGKGIKKFVKDKVTACKDILSNAKNRVVLGIIITGIGMGLGPALIVSGYVKLPC